MILYKFDHFLFLQTVSAKLQEGSRTDGPSAGAAVGKYANMKVLELRRMLIQRGLPMSGSAEAMRQTLEAEDARSDASAGPTHPTHKYDGMKVLALRRELKTRGLDMSGSENELKQRLAEHDAQQVLIIDN